MTTKKFAYTEYTLGFSTVVSATAVLMQSVTW